MLSMSSRMILAARSLMLEKNISRRLSEAPFSARASWSFSTARSRVWTPPGSSLERSSKTNIRARMRSAALAVALFQGGDEAGLGLAVEVVEDVGHHLVAVALGGARQVRHELGAQGLLDLVEDLALHRLHAQHAGDAFQREVLGQARPARARRART